MEAFLAQVSPITWAALGMGLLGLILLAVIAARLGRANDLLDEIMDMVTTTETNPRAYELEKTE